MSEGPVATGAAMLNAANAGSDTSSPTQTSASESAPATPPVANQPTAPVQTSQGTKPYARHLEAIPEGLRPMVEPTFQEWDREVNKRFDEVHSRYSPYKEFIDAGLQPAQLREAVDLMRMVVQDPRRIYEALGEHLGITPQQAQQVMAQGGQGQVGEPDEFDLGAPDQAQQYNLENDPRYQQLLQQQEQVMGLLQQQQEQAAAAEGEAWVSQKMSGAEELLKSKGIEPDWDYILGVAAAASESRRFANNDQAFDYAVENFVNKVDSWRTRPAAGANAPLVMPTSGGTPSTGLPPLETAKDRKTLGSEMLKAAFRNG